MFKTVPLRITGGDQQSRSTALNSQSLVNLYIDRQNSGRTPDALMPWPGEKLYAEAEVGKCRGMRVVDERLFVIFARGLYEITSDGLAILKADIPGEDRVYLEDDGNNLLIRLEGTAAFINLKFIVQGNGLSYLYNLENESITTLVIPSMLDDEFIVSDVGKPTVYRAINKASAQLTGDSITQIKVFQQKVVMAGPKSMEFFYDEPAGGNPPIFPIRQASTTRVGVGSKFSMAETSNYFYFLGNDNSVYRVQSYQAAPISTSAISKELRGIDKTDTLGFTVQLDGQWFYILQFPNANATLVYSEESGEWLRLSSGVSIDIPKHIVSGVAYVFGKILIAGESDGKVYEWDYNTYTSNGNTIIRQFITAPINGIALGMPGRRFFTNKFILMMESGVGNEDEANPVAMFSSSKDGGRSFEAEDFIPIGRAGDSGVIVEWYTRQTFYDLSLKVRVSDPNFTGFHAATIDVKDGGI